MINYLHANAGSDIYDFVVAWFCMMVRLVLLLCPFFFNHLCKVVYFEIYIFILELTD